MSRRSVVAVAVLAVLVAGCGGPESGLLPPPSSTSSTSSTSTTEPVDRSLTALEAFPGETTTTALLESGRARLRGRVLGPGGGAGGAIVRVERLVGDAVQRRDVPTGPGGVFDLANVPGGRYRVRAFLAPRLAMTSPEIFFLEDGGDRELDLRTEVFEGLTVGGSTNPAEPVVGQPVNIAVRVAERAVDANGVGREVPLSGIEVRLRTSGFAQVGSGDEDDAGDDESENSEDSDDEDSDDEDSDEDDAPAAPTVRVTDANGVIVFPVACERAGATSATAVVVSGDSEQTFSIEVPACAPRPTPTTAPDADDPDDATTTTGT